MACFCTGRCRTTGICPAAGRISTFPPSTPPWQRPWQENPWQPPPQKPLVPMVPAPWRTPATPNPSVLLECKVCSGTGTVEDSLDEGVGIFACLNCHGTGKVRV